VHILHGISLERYAIHGAQLFIERSGVPHAHVKCTPGMGHIRLSTRLYVFLYEVRTFHTSL